MSERQVFIGLSVTSVVAIILACTLGSTSMSFDRLLTVMAGIGTVGDQIVFWEIRLPRALAAFTVGAALGLSGAALQGLLRNPLAEPGVLGVSSAATLGATLTLFYGLANFHALAVPIAAILGAIAATALLSGAAMFTASATTLILIGVGISSFSGALMALLLNLAPNPFSLSDLISWSLGSVANKSFNDLSLIAPFFLLGTGIIIIARRDLAALTLGEEAAASIGANLKRTRLLIILGTGLVTGAAVSIAGAIGFVGIVAPHILRPLVSYRPDRLLIPSALLGGTMLVITDIIVRILPTPTELRLGVVVALIGAPAFIWIAAQRRMSHD